MTSGRRNNNACCQCVPSYGSWPPLLHQVRHPARMAGLVSTWLFCCVLALGLRAHVSAINSDHLFLFEIRSYVTRLWLHFLLVSLQISETVLTTEKRWWPRKRSFQSFQQFPLQKSVLQWTSSCSTGVISQLFFCSAVLFFLAKKVKMHPFSHVIVCAVQCQVLCLVPVNGLVSPCWRHLNDNDGQNQVIAASPANRTCHVCPDKNSSSFQDNSLNANCILSLIWLRWNSSINILK